jgi:hypothetical protein
MAQPVDLANEVEGDALALLDCERVIGRLDLEEGPLSHGRVWTLRARLSVVRLT